MQFWVGLSTSKIANSLPSYRLQAVCLTVFYLTLVRLAGFCFTFVKPPGRFCLTISLSIGLYPVEHAPLPWRCLQSSTYGTPGYPCRPRRRAEEQQHRRQSHCISSSPPFPLSHNFAQRRSHRACGWKVERADAPAYARDPSVPRARLGPSPLDLAFARVALRSQV